MESSDQGLPSRAELLAELDALRATEHELRILLDESSDPIFAFFPDGMYRYVNRAFALGVGKKPEEIIGKHIWDERLEDIAAYERYLARQGTVVLKFFLNVSKGEQKRRFLSRIEEPEKNWKFSANDVAERAHWDEYMAAYEAAIRGTAAPHAPWFVVPADNKWFTRLTVVAAIVHALEGLDLHYPRVTKAERAGLEVARKALT